MKVCVRVSSGLCIVGWSNPVTVHKGDIGFISSIEEKSTYFLYLPRQRILTEVAGVPTKWEEITYES